MIQLKKILWPTDFSSYSQQALNYAKALAQEFNAELYLLHVIEDLPSLALESFQKVAGVEYWANIENRVLEALEATAEEVGEGIVVNQVIRRGNPFAEIIKVAREQTIDLIVIATHGRSGLSHALMGSTTEKVVRKAPCPVLSIKSPEHEFVMP